MSGAYSSVINEAANSYGIPPALVKAVATQESSLGRSSANIMQVNSGATGVRSIQEGAQMLATYWNRTGHNLGWTLAMYNMGPGIYEWAKSHGINDPATAMRDFSSYMKSTHHLSGYGDVNYIDHVSNWL